MPSLEPILVSTSHFPRSLEQQTKQEEDDYTPARRLAVVCRGYFTIIGKKIRASNLFLFFLSFEWSK